MNEKELYMWPLQPHLTFSMSTNHSFNTYPVLQFVLGDISCGDIRALKNKVLVIKRCKLIRDSH